MDAGTTQPFCLCLLDNWKTVKSASFRRSATKGGVFCAVCITRFRIVVRKLKAVLSATIAKRCVKALQCFLLYSNYVFEVFAGASTARSSVTLLLPPSRVRLVSFLNSSIKYDNREQNRISERKNVTFDNHCERLVIRATHKEYVIQDEEYSRS
jgi:hypothetical protein